MFQGVAQLSLDSKGRLVIPARYRDVLLAHCAGQLELTADADGCLLLYPQPEWQPIRVGHAEDVVMDAAGRVLISPTLRGYAVLDKRVMLVGQGNKCEVWDEARWLAQHEKMNGFSDSDLPPELEGFTL